MLSLTDKGVSLFKITCSKCGGKTGGAGGFSQGLVTGISFRNPNNKEYIQIGMLHFYLIFIPDSILSAHFDELIRYLSLALGKLQNHFF